MPEIRCPLESAVEQWPELPALIDDNGCVSYRDFNLSVIRYTQLLKQQGIVDGSAVGIAARNSAEYICLLHALWRLKAVACWVNYRVPGQQITGLFNTAGCGIAYHNGEASVGSDSNMKRFRELPDCRADDNCPEPRPEFGEMIDLEQQATIMFTSGSSTKPKAVCHSYGNHYYSALGSNENIRVAPGDRWLLSLPLYHVGGLSILFRTMLGGAAVVLMDDTTNPALTIKEQAVTHLSLVPTQLLRLLEANIPEEARSQVRAVLIGGGPTPHELIRQAREAGWPVFTTYGLTEMSSQVTTSAPGAPVGKLHTAGRLLPYRELKISADGEILVRGQTLFLGYFDNDGITKAVDDDGWFHTGDIGQLDEDGCLKPCGRKDNMFISGGENIHPEEIEQCLNAISGIAESLVVAVSDEQYGHRPVAFVRLASGSSCNSVRIRELLAEVLPGFKLPVRFYHWPETDSVDLKPNRTRFVKLIEKGEAVALN